MSPTGLRFKRATSNLQIEHSYFDRPRSTRDVRFETREIILYFSVRSTKETSTKMKRDCSRNATPNLGLECWFL